MNCPHCGTENAEEHPYCGICGTPLHAQQPQSDDAPPPTPSPYSTAAAPKLPASRKAVTSLILGIIGLPVCILGIPAIITGALGLRDIRRRPDELSGKHAAIAGIVLGGISTLGLVILVPVIFIAVPNILKAHELSYVSIARSDMRSMATAIETYYIDNNAYPAWATGDQSIHAQLPSDHPAFRVQTFRIRNNQNPNLVTLTTPIAYITSHFPDRYAEVGATYRYFSRNEDREKGWILISPGPDRDYDFDPADYYYPGKEEQLIPFAYDPTNGTVSDGDIYRVKH